MMSFLRSLCNHGKEWLGYLGSYLKNEFLTRRAANLEIIALKSQLASYVHRFEKNSNTTSDTSLLPTVGAPV